MAITGEGTQDSPYLVSNIEDFRSACAETDVYVKLTADLNCNKEGYHEWARLSMNAQEVDFNGFSLIAPYIKSSAALFDGRSNTPTTIKNGYILNVFESGASVCCAYCWFYNMGIIVYGGTFNYEVFNQCYFDGCNVQVEHHNINKKCWFASPSLKDNLIGMNSNFYINGRVANSTSCSIFYGGDAATTLNGCRVEGKISPCNGVSNTSYFINGKALNSVINVDTSAFDNHNYSINFGGRGSNSIYNKDITTSKAASLTGYTACTTEEILNPDHNNSIGFTVVEKTS